MKSSQSTAYLITPLILTKDADCSFFTSVNIPYSGYNLHWFDFRAIRELQKFILHFFKITNKKARTLLNTCCQLNSCSVSTLECPLSQRTCQFSSILRRRIATIMVEA